MTACRTCAAPIPPTGRKGRPRLYCEAHAPRRRAYWTAWRRHRTPTHRGHSAAEVPSVRCTRPKERQIVYGFGDVAGSRTPPSPEANPRTGVTR